MSDMVSVPRDYLLRLQDGLCEYAKLPTDRWPGPPSSLLKELNAILATAPKPDGEFSQCDFCDTWRSKPCGEGCYWSAKKAPKPDVDAVERVREACAAELERAFEEASTYNLLHGAARIRALDLAALTKDKP